MTRINLRVRLILKNLDVKQVFMTTQYLPNSSLPLNLFSIFELLLFPNHPIFKKLWNIFLFKQSFYNCVIKTSRV